MTLSGFLPRKSSNLHLIIWSFWNLLLHQQLLNF